MIACQLITTPRYSVFGSSMVAKSVRKESSAAATGSTDGADVFDIPRMRLRELNTANSSRFVGLMEKHGFVVLTELGAMRDTYLEFSVLLKAFFEGQSEWKEGWKGGVYFNERGIPMWHAGYERCGDVREAFRIPISLASSPIQAWPCPRLRQSWLAVLRLLQLVCHRALTITLGRPVLGAPPSAKKGSRVKGRRPPKKQQVGASRGVGEAAAGEHCSASAAAAPGGGGGVGERSAGQEERDAGHGGGGNLCTVCGGRQTAGADAGVAGFAAVDRRRNDRYIDARNGGVRATAERRAQQWRDEGNSYYYCCPFESDREGDNSSDEDAVGGGSDSEGEGCHEGDFSVSYALHYPNECADPALLEEDLTVGEHVDPSLFVAEPCCGVEGLEVQDRATGRWLPVEALCAGLGGNGSGSLLEAEGRELILFGGKALERATEGRVRGAPHRVRRGDLGRRYCFIYEQKYPEFFPPPALD